MEQKKEEVYEIAILGRATWDLHSLNNEGTVGNVTEPRTLVLADGTQTDGISGEMLKHMHAEKVWALETDKRKFCEMCTTLRPERADGDSQVKNTGSSQDAVRTAITSCELCDIHGFLVQKPQATRASTIEFGWAVGIPDVRRDIHVHARHSTQGVTPDEIKEKGKWDDNTCSVPNCDTQASESQLFRVGRRWYCEEHIPTAQMLYHRPTRSGTYAIVSVFQPWRIGLNNVNFNYDVNDNNGRKSRYQLALKAYQAMFMRPEGAMTSTRLPHTEDFEGLIVVSKTNFPVPIISPLKDDYKKQIEAIKSGIDSEGNIDIMDFNSVSGFVEKIKTLLEKNPYKVKFKKEEEENSKVNK